MSLPNTFDVELVDGHSVPVRSETGDLVMGRFLGVGPDGKRHVGPLTIPDTTYHREMVERGALTLYVPPAPAPEAASAPAAVADEPPPAVVAETPAAAPEAPTATPDSPITGRRPRTPSVT